MAAPIERPPRASRACAATVRTPLKTAATAILPRALPHAARARRWLSARAAAQQSSRPQRLEELLLLCGLLFQRVQDFAEVITSARAAAATARSSSSCTSRPPPAPH